jgi:hypothetical protein
LNKTPNHNFEHSKKSFRCKKATEASIQIEVSS